MSETQAQTQTQTTEIKEMMKQLTGPEWMALKWMDGDKLASGVHASVVSTTGGKLIKLTRTDLKQGKYVLPLVFATDMLFKLGFTGIQGNKRVSGTGKDTAVSVVLQISDRALCEKLAELQRAYCTAALALRDQWAPKNWHMMSNYKDDAVLEVMRRKFGWEPPYDKNNKEAFDTEKCFSAYPRPPRGDEYAGTMTMKILPKYFKAPEGDAEDGDVLDVFEDMDVIDGKTFVHRADINYTSTGFFKFGCLGVCPQSETKMQHMWRVFGGVVSRKTAEEQRITPSMRMQMRAIREEAAAEAAPVPEGDAVLGSKRKADELTQEELEEWAQNHAEYL